MLIRIGVALLLAQVGLYAIPWFCDADPSWLNGFRGNIVAGVVGSVFFLVVGIFLNREIEEIQKETHQVVLDVSSIQKEMIGQTTEIEKVQKETRQVALEVQKIVTGVSSLQIVTAAQTTEVERMQATTLRLVEAREAETQSRERHDSFIRFLSRESYHEAQFPNLTTPNHPMGLRYRIAPVREDGRPRRHVTEMSEFYLVRILDISFRAQLNEQQLLEYDTAPIKVGEAYFCGFYNGAWHLGSDDLRIEHEFDLIGRVGPVETGISANDLVGENGPPLGARSLGVRVITSNGTIAEVGQGGLLVELFECAGPTFRVKLGSSPPKLLDLTQVPPRVEQLEGYFRSPEAKDRFRAVLLTMIAASEAHALFEAADEQEARRKTLEQMRRAAAYPVDLFEVPVVFDHQLRCFELFLKSALDPVSQRVAFLAAIGLLGEVRLLVEKEGPLGLAGIGRYSFDDLSVVAALTEVQGKAPISLIRPLFDSVKHTSASVTKALRVEVNFEQSEVDARFDQALVEEWKTRCGNSGIALGGYDQRSLNSLLHGVSRQLHEDLDKVAQTLNVAPEVTDHQGLLTTILADQLIAHGLQ